MPVRSLGAEELRYLKQVLNSGSLSVVAGGKMQTRFEKAFARAHGAKFAVAMNSGMSALHAAVITAGVGRGDEVICDPVCVFGSLGVLYQGGTPVFVDCQPVTFNMNPELIEAQITRRTKAIIVTHIGGLPAEMDRIVRIARKNGLMVIEDCAHAFTAPYKGRFAGTWGDIGCFSLQESKQLALGDGAMALTNRKWVADALSLHAGAPTLHATAYGVHYNFRMNEVTAAIGLAQVPKTVRLCRELRKLGRMWDQAVADCPWIVAQKAPDKAESTYHLWVATFEGERHGITRKRFREALRKHRVPIDVGYTGRPAYRHPVFKKVFPRNAYPKGLCPMAERMVPRMMLGYTKIPMSQAERHAGGLKRVIADLTP